MPDQSAVDYVIEELQLLDTHIADKMVAMIPNTMLYDAYNSIRDVIAERIKGHTNG